MCVYIKLFCMCKEKGTLINLTSSDTPLCLYISVSVNACECNLWSVLVILCESISRYFIVRLNKSRYWGRLIFHPVATFIQSMKCPSYLQCSLSSLCPSLRPIFSPTTPCFFQNLSHLLSNLSIFSPGYCIHLGSDRDEKDISTRTWSRTQMTCGSVGSACWPERRRTSANMEGLPATILPFLC